VILHSFAKAGLFYQMGQSYKVMGTYNLDESGNYMNHYPAGATALLLGLLCITAIPPSGMFISELLMFKAMVANGDYLYMAVAAILLCFVLYALLTRVLHIVFSQPRTNSGKPGEKVNAWQTVSQYILFGLVIVICFTQPGFLRDMIRDIIQNLPK
jgi:hydrogenase-4 component F